MSANTENETASPEKFVISRTFATSVATMFEMWTNPVHFSQWLPPQGFSMQFMKTDIRPGGSCFYAMSGPGDVKMYGRITYLDIQKPGLLIYTQQFCDEHDRISRHPFSPTWPETMLSTVAFTEDVPGQTTVKVTWQPYGKLTAEEIDTFVKSMAGMTQGWTGSFDKLDAYLLSQ